jgi:hypothetical protein
MESRPPHPPGARVAQLAVRARLLRRWRRCHVDADAVDQRLGALGVVPEGEGQRGLFGRGLRDVWLAQGGGRIQGARGERAVETWFLPAAGDEPYVYTHVLDTHATRAIRRELGIPREGTRVTVPLADGRLPPNARLRRLVSDLVQLRPILEDDSPRPEPSPSTKVGVNSRRSSAPHGRRA